MNIVMNTLCNTLITLDDSDLRPTQESERYLVTVDFGPE